MGRRMRRMIGLNWAVAWAAGCALTLAGATAAAQASPPQGFTPEQVATGAQLYERFCSACHGARMEDTETAFNLRNFPRDEKPRFVDSVTEGKNSMPPWGGLLTPEQIEALWAYVMSRQAAVSAPAGPAPAGPAAPNDVQAAMQNAKVVPPLRIFDNLYSVGLDWVSAYVIRTSAGLILVDTLYGRFADHTLTAMRELGLDPKDLKYALVTEARLEYVGGAGTVQAATGARVGMTEAGWTLLEVDGEAGRLPYQAPPRDLLIRDGQTLTLGDTTLRFYHTPGEMAGALSMEFPVRDGTATYQAFLFGGVGLDFEDTEEAERVLQSVRRLMTVPGVQVNVPVHPSQGKLFERAERLAARKPGEPHAFVAPQEWELWLQSLLANAEKKLEEEKPKAALH